MLEWIEPPKYSIAFTPFDFSDLGSEAGQVLLTATRWDVETKTWTVPADELFPKLYDVFGDERAANFIALLLAGIPVELAEDCVPLQLVQLGYRIQPLAFTVRRRALRLQTQAFQSEPRRSELFYEDEVASSSKNGTTG